MELQRAIEKFDSEDKKFQDLKDESERGMFKFKRGNLIAKIKDSSAEKL